MNITEILIPFTIALFVIAAGVVLLYQNFQKHLVELELEKAEIKSAQQVELLRNSILVQEEERKRIAADLHDEIGAVVSIIKMNLMLMMQNATGTQAGPFVKNGLQNMVDLSNTAITSVRTISHKLMPPQLEAFGLVKTIESVVDNINESGKIAVNFTVTCEWPTVNWPVALGIYRIIMELLNNTIRHADATRIFLEFDCLPENLIITFEDNGKGFPESLAAGRGLGIMNMEARVRSMNGLFVCANGAGAGIKATITIPVTALL